MVQQIHLHNRFFTSHGLKVEALNTGNCQNDGVDGDGVAVCMVDMGNRFRLICAAIELVKQPKDMPKLPVARIMWKLKPDHATGAAAWIYAGGAHHTVVSTALTVEDVRLFAKLTDTEIVVIDENTDLAKLQNELEVLDLLAKLK